MTTPEPPQTYSGGAPQMSADKRPIVAFDFDGTLTVRDSFTAFLRWRTGRAGWTFGLLRLIPAILVYIVGHDRGRLKGASLCVFLKGLTRAELASEAEAFAAENFHRLLRPDALAAWNDRADCQARRIIVTASPEDVVAPFARRLQADELVGSRIRWTQDGRVGCRLEGRNCRGAEKVRRLEALCGPDLNVWEAFGDTSGDREMLAIANSGHMRVFRGRPALARSDIRSS